MRLFEAIIDANHRALKGDPNAGIYPADFLDELPLVVLTCIDPRLNPLFPSVLGLPEDQFIWLRNAGNVITGPITSTMRSLSLACAVKGGKEIAIIGHTDCLVSKTTAMQLIERLHNLGIERHVLPDNVQDYFGLFSNERQNVIKAVEFVRHSPLIGSKIPVHGLVVNIATGGLEWVVNGYQTLDTLASCAPQSTHSAEQTLDALKSFTDFNIGEMKFPETKIGEVVVHTENWLTEKVHQLEASQAAAEAKPPKIPLPPPVKPKLHLRKERR
jgi:carbonic anhydrase